MIVEHPPDGRTLADTAALAAVTGRSPTAVRRWCEPAAGGLYDVAQAELVLAGVPEPQLYPGSRLAGRAVGVSPSAVRMWVARRQLSSWDRTPDGRPLYDLADLRRLAGRRADG